MLARAQRLGAIRSITDRPPRKVLKPESSHATNTPLLDQENAARLKWAARLEEIGRKAGAFSKLLIETSNETGLSSAEIARLRQLVLSSGAPRTMAVHVGNWERFADWIESQEMELYPLSHTKLLQYAMFLDRNECGPSVLPTFRSSVKWVTSKLAIECPEVDHPALLALQAEIITKRATTLKEAIPIPVPVVSAIEQFVVQDDEPEAARLFMWWWLCMIFASLRFDDALHVKPCELVLNEKGLFGIAWQTKVERKRRGTKFCVPHVGFSGPDWLRAGWTMLQKEDLNRDFWICELNTREKFLSVPPTYARSLLWLKFLARHSVNQFHQGEPADYKELCAVINQITAHSARVTMLDAAVHAGRSTEEIGLQANWKNPGPLVLKYTRNRSDVPAKMVQKLVQDMLVTEHPIEVDDDAVLEDEDPAALQQIQFYIKESTARSSYMTIVIIAHQRQMNLWQHVGVYASKTWLTSAPSCQVCRSCASSVLVLARKWRSTINATAHEPWSFY